MLGKTAPQFIPQAATSLGTPHALRIRLALLCTQGKPPQLNLIGELPMQRKISFATVTHYIIPGCLAIASFSLASEAQAQRPWHGSGFHGSSFHFRPGGYHHVGGNLHHNPVGGSLYQPGFGVRKGFGSYAPVGNGYYQNHWTGNVYNPNTGSYSAGKHLSFSPGGYNRVGRQVFHNPVTGSVHVPGAAVLKGSGVYAPVGNGYYRNPFSGNVYNPNTGAYKSW